MIPGGRVGPHRGIQVLHNYIIVFIENLQKISSQKPAEKPELVWKHPQVVLIQLCLNYGSWGRVGRQWSESSLT